jgi:predicted permease
VNTFRKLRARLRGFFRKEELEEEVDEELRFHVAMRTQENIARGMEAAEAARQAQRQFGNVNLVKDSVRDVIGGGALESFSQDVRFAARMLLKDRGFTIVAVLALALGIGANTALFTVLSNVLLRPLPYPDAEAIMAVAPRHHSRPNDLTPASYLDYLDLREQNRVFERLGAFQTGRFVVRTENGEPAQVQGARVTSDVFPLLGAKAESGRIFSRAEEEPGRRAAVVSHEMWEKQFDKLAKVGKATLTIDGADYTVIGVMPRGFRFPVQNNPAQFWITFSDSLERMPDGSVPYPFRRASHFLRLLGRLKPGVTQEQAHADVNAIAADLAVKFPETNRNYANYIVVPWLEAITRQVRPLLLMLIAAAVFALGVACANVANLLLARASTRRKEIALRVVLGAGRMRILRQLLTESLLLASIGGVAGLLLALVGTRYLVSALPHDFPRASEIAPNAMVLGFAVLVTFLTSCLFGLAPGWRSAREKLAPLLNDASTGMNDTPGGRRTRNILVVAEMVAAFVLLGGACFFITNLARLRAAPLGFNPAQLLTATVSVPDDELPKLPERAAALFEQIGERLRHTEGVEGATFVSRLPLSGARSLTDFRIAGRPMSQADLPLTEPHIVPPGYFGTMGIPLTAGRDFDGRDTAAGVPAVIVNATLAQKIFPGENPIGKRITPGVFINTPAPLEREIVGVVGDVRTDMLAAQQPMQVYLPLAQCPVREMTLLVRATGEPHDLLPAIRELVAELNEEVAVAAPATMEELIDGSVAVPRLNSALLAAFALLAVVLTAIGVYGVMAYSVTQRRLEIGVRLALGARKLDIMRLVISEGVRLIAWSIITGAAFTAVMLPWLQALATRPSGNNLLLLSVAAVLLAVVALVACWLPARRAAAVDTLTALGER